MGNEISDEARQLVEAFIKGEPAAGQRLIQSWESIEGPPAESLAKTLRWCDSSGKRTPFISRIADLILTMFKDPERNQLHPPWVDVVREWIQQR